MTRKNDKDESASAQAAEDMAKAIAAILDPQDMRTSARACADGFNRVFSVEYGYVAKLMLSGLAFLEEDEKNAQNRL